MYLIHTWTITLDEFAEPNIPSYAILSHRWENDEVLYREFRDGKAKNHFGFNKIEGCCKVARLDGWEYVWIDTCCIDKSSSTELSEAINSMYRLYKDTKVSYAYLGDVPAKTESAIRVSKWFTWGWTLQEPLAPTFVVFYDRWWNELGTRYSMSKLITSITSIPNLYLENSHPSGASIAQRMSWASNRDTSRVEDTAYCFMGLRN